HTRSWALLHNFRPYCPRAKVREICQSPAHKLNGFVYRDNWLENLLVATSLQGFHVSSKICKNQEFKRRIWDIIDLDSIIPKLGARWPHTFCL
ncbi:MAG: hypothetical protein ACE5FD_01485, partial [Anaerolineae bacterium]